MILKIKVSFWNSWKIIFWSAIWIWTWIIIFDSFNLNFHKFIRHSDKTKPIMFIFTIKKSSLGWIDIWITKIVGVLSRCPKSKLMNFFPLNGFWISLFWAIFWFVEPFCAVCTIYTIDIRFWRKSFVFVNVSVVLKMFMTIEENIEIAFFDFW